MKISRNKTRVTLNVFIYEISIVFDSLINFKNAFKDFFVGQKNLRSTFLKCTFLNQTHNFCQ